MNREEITLSELPEKINEQYIRYFKEQVQLRNFSKRWIDLVGPILITLGLYFILCAVSMKAMISMDRMKFLSRTFVTMLAPFGAVIMLGELFFVLFMNSIQKKRLPKRKVLLVQEPTRRFYGFAMQYAGCIFGLTVVVLIVCAFLSVFGYVSGPFHLSPSELLSAAIYTVFNWHVVGVAAVGAMEIGMFLFYRYISMTI